MKKVLLIAMVMFTCNTLFAKKVKFAVNMSNYVVNTTGIHVYGDFQVAAGYPYNLDPGSTVLTQEAADTNVYSIVVDIPAFHVYEYRFINGDQAYETEFVPEESRVNGTFDDNRWIYVDSTANDTTFIGVIPYEANAPLGLSLVVFKVNMSLQTVTADSVHVAGSFQGWDPGKSMMISFNDTVYRYQAFIPNGTYQFKFVNGNTAAGYEYVGGACAVNGNREVIVSGDIALEPYNFGSCIVGISENQLASAFSLYPNPSVGFSRIEFNDQSDMHEVIISDAAGRRVRTYTSTESTLEIDKLEAGVYAVSILNSSDQATTIKLIVQ